MSALIWHWCCCCCCLVHHSTLKSGNMCKGKKRRNTSKCFLFQCCLSRLHFGSCDKVTDGKQLEWGFIRGQSMTQGRNSSCNSRQPVITYPVKDRRRQMHPCYPHSRLLRSYTVHKCIHASCFLDVFTLTQFKTCCALHSLRNGTTHSTTGPTVSINKQDSLAQMFP